MRRWNPPHHLMALCALVVSLLWPMASANAQARHDTDARYKDAHVDRVVLSPTAETHPQGTFYASLYDFVFQQVGFAPTQRTQLTMTSFSDFQPDPSFFLEFTLKANLLRTRTLRIAVINALDVIRVIDDSGSDAQLVFGRIGATAQWCFDDACDSSVNLSGMLVIHDKADVLVPFGGAIGFVGKLAGTTKMLLEYGTLNSLSSTVGVSSLSFWYVGYGVRFAHPRWSLDVTLVRELDLLLTQEDRRNERSPVFDLIGLPLLAFTYRFGHL